MTNSPSKRFALADCNNFYVSVERLFYPRLQNRPVTVLSNNDGCVVARSNEVKAIGVKMGTPWFQLKELAKQHDIVALSSNYTLYGDMSNRVMTILREFAPTIEVYSIDEAFLSIDDIGRLWPTPDYMGQAMRARVMRDTGLPICVGFGSSKTLAKLANHIAKKNAQYSGVCDLDAMPPAECDAVMRSIDVGEVWGVGRQFSAKLQKMNVASVADLRAASLPWIRSHFGVVMERTVMELRGVACLEMEECAPAKKQIVCSRSFGALITDIGELGDALSSYLARAAEKLRRQSSECSAVHVFIMTNRFREQDAQYCNGITIGLPSPTSDNRTLTGASLAGLRKIFRPGYLYKKVGVMLLELTPCSHRQCSLFEPNQIASENLMATVDALNKRFGRDTLKVASAGRSKSWAMCADRLSPRNTTRWAELPVAKAD